MRLVLAFALLGACAGNRGNGDTFVEGGSAIAGWATTSDARVKVPLAAGMKWSSPESGAESTLLKVRSEAGPTFIVVAKVNEAPTPLSLQTCAKAHGDKLAAAMSSAKVLATPPTLSEELRRGERVPRLHYLVPLQAAGGARGAATMSWWTYFLDRDRCIAIGVSSLVREREGDPNSPDPEDLHRVERVFSLVSEQTVIAK